ncbi:MAG: nicotinate-nucleotide adenylyltransferase [Tissierellia bacterium]|nr:nicotinate-nucleotide adenylyltransferase [Tissierellia bacterium]
MRIGIMGGTFNPIHMGHLMMSEYIRDEMNLDKILYIPTGNPPHKQIEIVDALHRLEMVKLAIKDNPYFEVSNIEVERTGFSYSVDTVMALKKIYPKDELFFLIGSDILPELKDWRRFDELAKSIEFILAVRPGYESISKEQIYWEINALKEEFGAEITVVKTPRYEVSSTNLRSRLARNKSVKYLIPKDVISFIKENNLYRNDL